MKKNLIIFSIITICLQFVASAVELPNKPSGRTSVSIRMFGTNKNPANPPYFSFFAYEMRDDALLNSKAQKSEKVKNIEKRITKDEYAVIYKLFLQFFNQHKLSVERNFIRDGNSIEIKLSAGSESITVTFANDSYVKSQGVKTLIKMLEEAQVGTTHTLLMQFK